VTREEAIEIVIGEEPFKPCAECQGLGFPAGDVGDCPHCLQDVKAGGTGKVRNIRHVEACTTLGMELPPAVWDMQWFIKHDAARREKKDAKRSSNRVGEEDGQEGRSSDDRPQSIR
jgi:hypothetical protein